MQLDDNISKFLTEAMGGCWHTFIPTTSYRLKCTKCDKGINSFDRESAYIDFSTWEGFGILLSWAKQQVWWYSFIGISSDGLAHDDWEALAIDLVNPEAFAMAVYEELIEE